MFGHIKTHVQQNILQNQTLLSHINDVIQAMTIGMVQGWIREVDQNFDRASHREWLGECYAWCTVLSEVKLYNSWNWFCEVIIMGNKSWNCS